MERLRLVWRAGLVLLSVCGLATAQAAAQQSSSTNYQVNEVYFGPGGSLGGASTNYKADQSAGDTADGRTKSTNYQAVAGGDTRRSESLSLTVNNPNADLGVLSVGAPSTTTATFSVQSYLSSGYVVTNASDPPVSSGSSPHTFANLTTATASTPGTEQFGINLVANTSPSSFGAAPAQQPDSTFSNGAAASGYNTANKFRYIKGDTIASASSSSGTTLYTVSYLYNISNVTPAGRYTFSHVLVATATF